MIRSDQRTTNPALWSPAQLRAVERAHFFAALNDLQPGCLDEYRAIDQDRMPLYTKSAVRGWKRGDVLAVEEHIRQWQGDWNLAYPWVFTIAHDTTKHLVENEDNTYPDERLEFIIEEAPYEGRPGYTSAPIERNLAGRGFSEDCGVGLPWDDFNIYLEDLLVIELVEDDRIVYEADNYIGSFDPRGEPKESAKTRMMKELEDRLSRALDHCIGQDRRWGADRGTLKRERQHYEWLIRSHILGQSKKSIAKDAGKNRRTIRGGIKSAKEKIGIPLTREEEDGGSC